MAGGHNNLLFVSLKRAVQWWYNSDSRDQNNNLVFTKSERKVKSRWINPNVDQSFVEQVSDLRVKCHSVLQVNIIPSLFDFQ